MKKVLYFMLLSILFVGSIFATDTGYDQVKVNDSWKDKVKVKLIDNKDATYSYVNRDYNSLVALGNFSNKSVLNAYGKLTTTGAVTNHIIWEDGDLYIPTANTQPSIVSTSANDTVGGTGMNSVHVHYLDGNFTDADEVVDLNGTNPVQMIATDVRFIQCMHLEQVGSLKSAAGDISAYDTNGTLSYIKTGAVRCSSASRMVPAGKTLLVKFIVASSTSATADTTTNVSIGSTYFEGHSYKTENIIIPQANLGYQNNSFGAELGIPFIVPEKEVFSATTTSNKAGTISLTWMGILEDN